MAKLILSNSIHPEDLEVYIDKLEYRNINSELYGIVGNWLISNDGDLLCYREEVVDSYTIYSYQHNDLDWRTHLGEKEWFSGSIVNDFDKAYEIAVTLASEKK